LVYHGMKDYPMRKGCYLHVVIGIVCATIFVAGCERGNVLTIFSNHSVSKKMIFSDSFDRSNGVPGNDWTMTVESNSYEGHSGTSTTILQISDGALYGKALNMSNDSYIASLKMRASRMKEIYDTSIIPCEIEFSFMYNRGDAAMYASNVYARLLAGSNLAGEGNDGTGIVISRTYFDGHDGISRLSVVSAGSEVSYSDYVFTPNTAYRIRMIVDADTVSAKAWKSTDPEPAEWTVTSATAFSDDGDNLNFFVNLENLGSESWGSWNEVKIDDVAVWTYE